MTEPPGMLTGFAARLMGPALYAALSDSRLTHRDFRFLAYLSWYVSPIDFYLLPDSQIGMGGELGIHQDAVSKMLKHLITLGYLQKGLTTAGEVGYRLAWRDPVPIAPQLSVEGQAEAA